MHIGVDVGGTYTDGVIIDHDRVIQTVKIPTKKNLAHSIELVIAQLAANNGAENIDKIVISTTLITNLLAEKKHESVGLLLLPGPGVNPADLNFVCPTVVIRGAVDYRGRIIVEADLREVQQAVEGMLAKGINSIAVACKFSQRNPVLENKVIEYLGQSYPRVITIASHRVSGLLNWLRRANGAALTLMISEKYHFFIRQIEESLAKMKICCPIYVLKADGGTLPLELALQYPLESVFSGPAASALGALAFADKNITSVVMDIGGTTTDLAIILNGVPLLSERGAFIDNYPIPVRGLALTSLALGGDTSITAQNGRVSLGPRKGQAYCLGGPRLTITDILVYLGKSDISSSEEVVGALGELAGSLGRKPQEIAAEVIDIFMDTLEAKLEEMFHKWEEEPAYHIWQVLSQQKKRPAAIICLGGPADGLGALWGERKGWDVQIPPYSPVANAIGAALAKTTLRLELHADTEQMRYSTNLGSVGGPLATKLKNTDEAKQFALSIFRELSDKWSLEKDYTGNIPETIYEESFNLIRDWHTSGKIFQIGLQTPSGIQTVLHPCSKKAPEGGAKQ